jgi:hypothetical protein
MSIYPKEYEAALALEHGEDMMDRKLAMFRLEKLTVAELRVLFAHYYPGLKRDAQQMRKEHLIDELVDQIVEDGR